MPTSTERPSPHKPGSSGKGSLDSPPILLENVRVHNLQNISLQIPLGELVVISGVSGSGKSSLAFDTLFAEGQRRYIETFSTYARQFLDRLPRPDADRILNIPPAIAVRQGARSASARATVATATEIHDYLRLLFARIGRVICPACRREVRRHAVPDVLDFLRRLSPGTRFLVCFPVSLESSQSLEDRLEELREMGFVRMIAAQRTWDLGGGLDELLALEPSVLSPAQSSPALDAAAPLLAIVDRLIAGKSDEDRIADSLEAAFLSGRDRCVILAADENQTDEPPPVTRLQVDGRPWRLFRFTSHLECETCGRQFPPPEPSLFSPNTIVGACPECRGFGAVPSISFEHLVPDPRKSLREGAIAPWTTPAYRHELDELLALAHDYNLPVDAPFSQLEPQHLQLILDGVPERSFGGLKGFFRWLERHRYKTSVGVFLHRWRTYEPCPICRGARLRPEALAVRLPAEGENCNIAELCAHNVRRVEQLLNQLRGGLDEARRQVVEIVLRELLSRVQYLSAVGLDYLTLDRTLRTLSSGESQRVALTAVLGTRLVNTLYVLDEPSAGLHPEDSQRVIECIRALRDLGNTVVVVEHEEAFLRAADRIVDIGPGAGRDGGRIVFEGSPQELSHGDHPESATARWFQRRPPDQQEAARASRFTTGRELAALPRLRLVNARSRNLKNVTVEFPLQSLCVVTGVSGSGKSTLVEETLFPALCRAHGKPVSLETAGEYDELTGADAVADVLMVDQSPIGRTPRSNPVTYLKAFDDIRNVFAQTPDARRLNFNASQFSFNSASGGRCPRCAGNGCITLEMQFLEDLQMECPECRGTRYRPDVLQVRYRDRTIADVLNMTVREAFTFFRTQRKLQQRLSVLKDIGLDYLPLGQPATTLSGGESQRLKLAAFLSGGTKPQTLFIIDEPTTGLHAADVAALLRCFARLLEAGHSLIVVEHNLDVIRAADYVIDLGPGAGDAGGRVLVAGPPEEIAACPQSLTGEWLRNSN